jgi:hypothetical protein
VLFYKNGYNQNIGQYNTSRPRFANANTLISTNIIINDAAFCGWYVAAIGY